MNRFVTSLAIAATALALPALGQSAAAPSAGPQKIGVIEVQRIVQESAVGKESVARVQKLQQAKQDELARRQKELRDLEQKIQDQGKSLSEDAMDKLQKDYQSRAVELKRAQDDAQRDLEESQRKELGDLEKRIMPVINTVAQEQGFSMVFNKFNSGLLYASEAVDLTDSVIKKFNAQVAAAPSAPAAPSASGTKPAPKPATTPAPRSPK